LHERMKKILYVFTAVLALAYAVEVEVEANREKKMFSLFNVVTFKNLPCKSNDGNRNGTCYTTTECTDKGGKTSGNCASGFGVCCLFTVQSASEEINQNCTYIQNPSFPTAYTETTALTYTIKKCADDVCAVRLDFETFTTQGPAATGEADGGLCVDSLVVSGSSGLTSPVICGMNSGQHVYMDMGVPSTATATLAFTFAGASTTRMWEIKATQIPCSANYRPDSGCLQYHQGLTGRIETFNFANTAVQSHLRNQNYNICIRQEQGYCCVQYSVCTDDNSYTLDADIAMAKTDTNCSDDFLGIDGIGMTCNSAPGRVQHTKLCGAFFNAEDLLAVTAEALCDCTAPYSINVVTDATIDAANTLSRGVCLEYRHVPC